MRQVLNASKACRCSKCTLYGVKMSRVLFLLREIALLVLCELLAVGGILLVFRALGFLDESTPKIIFSTVTASVIVNMVRILWSFLNGKR